MKGLTPQEIATLQAMPPSPTKDMMMQLAGIGPLAVPVHPADVAPAPIPEGYAGSGYGTPVAGIVAFVSKKAADVPEKPAPELLVEPWQPLDKAGQPVGPMTNGQPQPPIGPPVAPGFKPTPAAAAVPGGAGPAPAPGPGKSIYEQAYPKEMLDAYAQQFGLLDKQAQIAGAHGEALASDAHKKSLLLEDAQKQAQELADKQAQDEVDRNNFAKAAIDEHERETNELSKVKIDPDRYWKVGGTATAVTAIIGGALGVLGAALSGDGRNRAVEEINKQIDKDIDAQKADVQNKQAMLAQKNNIFAARMRVFGDERMAEASARATLWQGVQTKIESLKASTDEKDIKANADSLINAIDMKKNELLQGLTANAYSIVQKKQDAANAARMAELAEIKAQNKMIVEGQWKVASEQALAAGGVPVPVHDPSGRIVGFGVYKDGQIIHPSAKPNTGPNGPVAVNIPIPNGSGGYTMGQGMALNQHSAVEYQKKVESADAIEQIADELIAMRKKHEGGTLPLVSAEDTKIMRSKAAQAMLYVKSGTSGMSSDKDMATMADIVPEHPDALHPLKSGDPTMKALEEMKRRSVKMRELAAKMYLTPGAPGTQSSVPYTNPE